MDEPMKTMKRLLCIILAVLMFASLGAAAYADGDAQARAVIGANLDENQIASVYQLVNVKRGDVKEMTVTNAEEREYLEGYVDEFLIGTRSISCVYVELLGSGAVVVVEGALAERPPDLVNDGNGVFALANVDSDCYHTCHLSGMGLAAPG